MLLKYLITPLAVALPSIECRPGTADQLAASPQQSREGNGLRADEEAQTA
jgi:hypothetical protein